MTTYMNKPTMCICCFKKPEKREGHIPINGKLKKITVPLQRHHVQYFPEEIVAYVHDHCHDEIEAGKHPHLKQYTQDDVRKFYGTQKVKTC